MKTQYISTKLITAALLMCMTVLVPSVMAVEDGIPAGVYSTTITLADIPAEFPPEAADILVGVWTTEFTEAGTTVIRKNGDVVANGRYTSSKSYLVMRDISGPLACTDARGIANGVYAWSLENGELHLSTVLDRCFGRMFVLTLQPLQQL
jgi:hypothetical protein